MKIIGIHELDDYKLKNGDWMNYYGGFLIKTEGKDIHLLIDNSRICCENFGYISSNDDLSYFIGAEILDYKVIETDTYNELPIKLKKVLKLGSEYDINVLDCSFIKFETDRGSFDLTVYNHHNGYYGHKIKIIERVVSPLERVLTQDMN